MNLDDLISAYFDKSLSDEEFAELNTRIIEQPDFAKRFLATARVHSDMSLCTGELAESIAESCETKEKKRSRIKQKNSTRQTYGSTQHQDVVSPTDGNLSVCVDIAVDVLKQDEPIVHDFHRRKRWSVVVVAALVFLSLVAFFWQPQPSLHIQTDIENHFVGTDGLPFVGVSLQAGDVITGDGLLEYEDGTTIQTTGGSILEVRALGPQKKLHLVRGRIDVDAAKQDPEFPFHISVPQGDTYVIGTKFTIEAREWQTRLTVHEGCVRMSKGEQRKDVNAGETCLADSSGLNHLGKRSDTEGLHGAIAFDENFEGAWPYLWGGAYDDAYKHGRTAVEMLPLMHSSLYSMHTKETETPLFTARAQHHVIHLICQRSRRGVVNIMIGTRTKDGQREQLWKGQCKVTERNQWQSFSLPINSLLEKGDMPVAIDYVQVTAEIEHGSLIVDRIWVTDSSK